MSPSKKHDTFSFSGTDFVLLVVGLLGLACFAIFIPRLHPDSTASYSLTEEEAVDRANIFLSAQGYSADGLSTTALLKRNTDLLENLQRVLGRRDATRFLQSTSSSVLPAYYWSIQYRVRNPSAGEDDIFVDSRLVFEVQLNLDGAVISLANNSARTGSARAFGSALQTVNRTALASVVPADSVDLVANRARLAAVADTTVLKRFRFDLSRPGYASTAHDRLNLLESDDMIWMDSVDIKLLLDHHLSRTALKGVTWRTDSLGVPANNEGRLARVTLVSDPPVAGQAIVVTATLTNSGNLQQLALRFNPAVDNGRRRVAAVMRFVTIASWILLVIIFIVVFFRRLIARLVDVKSAMIDAVILGTLFGGLFVLTSNNWFGEFDWPVWADILVRVILFSIIAGGMSLFAFIVSGVTDSLARDRFPGKLRTMVLFRHGDMQNVPFGTMLIRGVLAGGILLGIVTLGMASFNQLQPQTMELMLGDAMIRPILGSVMGAFAVSWVKSMVLLMSFGVIAYKLSSKPVVVIAVVMIGSVILRIPPAEFIMGPEGVAVSVAAGLVIGAVFYRYDLMAVLSALFVSDIMWTLKEGFMVGGTDVWVDLLLGALLLTSVLVFGFIAILGGRTGRDLKEYVPEYVTEMASQERVKREVEIAYQVQANFLPRTMPRISGVDIAGMCLPANEVGGDYYDFIELPDDKVAFVVGDVSGKGIHASFYMTLVKGILQTLARLELPPAEVMRRLNHLFCINVPSGTFISMIYGVLEVHSGAFTFARAGHNPAILRRADVAAYTFLRPAGMAIGFSDGKVFDNGIEEMTVHLKVGDALVLYTDGFSEAMNSRRDLYGDERLAEKTAVVGSKSASAILRLLTEDVHHFIEGMGRSDDMTMVVVKIKAEA